MAVIRAEIENGNVVYRGEASGLINLVENRVDPSSLLANIDSKSPTVFGRSEMKGLESELASLVLSSNAVADVAYATKVISVLRQNDVYFLIVNPYEDL